MDLARLTTAERDMHSLILCLMRGIPPPHKRESPALGGTSNRAEFVSTSKIINTPNQHAWPTSFTRVRCLDGESGQHLIVLRRLPEEMQTLAIERSRAR
jgi:hypothetical protein